MSWLFSRRQKESSTNDSINQLQAQITLLEKRERLLQQKAIQEEEKARDFLKKKNTTCMYCFMIIYLLSVFVSIHNPIQINFKTGQILFLFH